MIISKAELDRLALGLVNAMILEGPSNEDQLHALQVLLDPESDDDLEWTVTYVNKYVQDAFGKLSNMVDEIADGSR